MVAKLNLANACASGGDELEGVGKVDEVAKLFENSNLAAYRQLMIDNPSLRKFAQYLSIEEEAIIKYYTTQAGYRDLNRALRGEIPITEFYKTQAEVLNSAINKLPKYTRTCFRGIGMAESNLANKLKVGDEIPYKDFTSSSMEEEIAEIFRQKGGGSVIYYIKSKTGVNISELSDASFESEILFKANSRFKVTNISFKPRFDESDPLIKEIYLDEL